jgi:hypothetical protein
LPISDILDKDGALRSLLKGQVWKDCGSMIQRLLNSSSQFIQDIENQYNFLPIISCSKSLLDHLNRTIGILPIYKLYTSVLNEMIKNMKNNDPRIVSIIKVNNFLLFDVSRIYF